MILEANDPDIELTQRPAQIISKAALVLAAGRLFPNFMAS
jgi:hypothetical protein